MVAIGTVVQRGGPLVEYFRGGPEGPVLVRDRVEATPGSLTAVDVLANDRELRRPDADRLEIVSLPQCGKAFVQDRRVHYVPEESCRGEQVIGYGIGRKDSPTGEVIVSILAPPTLDAEVPEPAIAVAPLGLAPGGLADVTDNPARGTSGTSPAQPGADGVPTEDISSAPERTIGNRLSSPSWDDDDRKLSLDDLGADPLAARTPTLPQPLGPAELDDAPLQIGAGASDESPVAASRGPTELGPVTNDAPALAQAEVSAPAARPQTATTRAPEALRTRVNDSRNNDFASATSRGGLLARPSRASTSAAPAPTIIAQIQESESLPAIGEIASAWRPQGLADQSVSEPDLALSAPETGLGVTRRAPVSGLQAPGADGSQPAAETTDLAEILPNPTGPEPRRVQPAALRFGASSGDRVSQLSPPPTAESLGPNRFDPQASQPTASISLARVDRSVGAFSSPGAPTIGRGPGTLAGPADNSVARATLPSGGLDDAGLAALAAPASGLGEVRSLGNALTIVPVDTTSAPAGLAAPLPEDEGVAISALPSGFNPDAVAVDPDTAATTGPDAQATEDDEAPVEDELATLPSADAACVIPPGITIDPRGGAFTQVIVKSPCHRGQAITLSYSGLEFGLMVDGNGLAQVLAPGFEPRSKARIAFPDGEALDLDISFADTDRVIRVALVWETAVSLELHALLNGRAIGSEGHVRPDRPGSLRKARRGGGFLTSYSSAGGVGENLQVYTHVPRRNRPEVIKLLIDYTSRRRGVSDEFCGEGTHAAPAFRVVRSTRGTMERVRARRLGAVECAEIRTDGARLIEQAVDDIVVSSR
ncbi:MAG: hypothetical protein AAGC57_06765 [Pseudomonadota bacterium]